MGSLVVQAWISKAVQEDISIGVEEDGTRNISRTREPPGSRQALDVLKKHGNGHQSIQVASCGQEGGSVMTLAPEPQRGEIKERRRCCASWLA